MGDLTALSLIRAMVAEYVHRDRANHRSISGRATPGQRAQMYGFAQAIIHAVSVAYGEDLDSATERTSDMIAEVMEGMGD